MRWLVAALLVTALGLGIGHAAGLDRLGSASAGTEATIDVSVEWVINPVDITLADGVVLTFACTPGEAEDRHQNQQGKGHDKHGKGKGLGHVAEGEQCPKIADVTATVSDVGGNPLGSVSATDVTLDDGVSLDFDSPVPITPIVTITVEVSVP